MPACTLQKLKAGVIFVALGWAAACGSNKSPAEPTGPTTPPAPAATAPVIVQQPQGTSIDESQSTSLSVVADGFGPLTYQWFMGARGVTEHPMPGGTGSTVQTGTLWVTAQFWVRIANAQGMTDSEAATVTVQPAPLPPVPPSPAPTPSPGPSPIEAFELDVLTVINGHRAAGAVCGGTSFGAAPALVMDSRLRTAARLHSQDMGANGYFSHTSLDGRTFSQRMSATGFNGAKPWGENIGAGYPSPAAVMAGLMASPGHCSNIMNPSYRAIGVGYAFVPGSPYGHYWTQNFAAGQ